MLGEEQSAKSIYLKPRLCLCLVYSYRLMTYSILSTTIFFRLFNCSVLSRMLICWISPESVCAVLFALYTCVYIYIKSLVMPKKQGEVWPIVFHKLLTPKQQRGSV